MSSESLHLPLAPRRGFAVRYYPALGLLLPAGMQLLQALPRDLRGVCIGLGLALTVAGDSHYYSILLSMG